MRGCRAPHIVRRKAQFIDNPSVSASPIHLPLHKGGFWLRRFGLRIPRVKDDGSKDVACLVMQIGHKDPPVVQQQHTIILP